MTTEFNVETLAEALQVLKGAGRIYVHCRIDAGIVGDSSHCVPDYYVGGLRITRPAAMSFLRDAFNHRTKPGRTMRLSVRVDEQSGTWCTKQYKVIERKPVKTVWIG